MGSYVTPNPLITANLKRIPSAKVALKSRSVTLDVRPSEKV